MGLSCKAVCEFLLVAIADLVLFGAGVYTTYVMRNHVDWFGVLVLVWLEGIFVFAIVVFTSWGIEIVRGREPPAPLAPKETGYGTINAEP